ncbi:MAG: gamma-glutamyltransferase [Rhodospirillaceae bacterium]|nr:gamma-glutamyltransferase [Rhodospirillaceae bacterium]|tara:strand:+ start:897 stop:2504 length:1608 start_codon:yes stop_codon:yes gene_type:complete
MKGLVVCPQPIAADVGARILERGGNAFDAAVAAAFAQMVVDPFMCGVGGMGTLQYFNPLDNLHGIVDFHSRAGNKVSPQMWEGDLVGRSEISGYSIFSDHRSELGYSSIMTPGTVLGFSEAHATLCSWDWADLLQPAIKIAGNGFPLAEHVRDFWTRAPSPGIPDGITRLTVTKPCSEIYLDGKGKIPNVGDIIRNPDMAKTFTILAQEGSDAFYRGAIADRIIDDFSANNAFITAQDLENYRVRSNPPIWGNYRDYQIASNPPPGSGALLIQMLQTLEHFDLASLGHNSGATMNTIASAMVLAHQDRDKYLADPDFVTVDTNFLISPERARNHAAIIESKQPLPRTLHTASSCTTHLSTLDHLGNAVSVTHTLGTGSGVVTQGLGFVYNNSMKLADPISGRPNSIQAGKARTTGMVPTIVFKEGQPVIIVGAIGGSVIISAVLQTIINIIDYGMSPMEAVSVPRIHCEGNLLHVEARIEGSQIAKLASFGHKVQKSPYSFDPIMARAHVIALSDKGWRGGADPRSGGGIAIARF